MFLSKAAECTLICSSVCSGVAFSGGRTRLFGNNRVRLHFVRCLIVLLVLSVSFFAEADEAAQAILDDAAANAGVRLIRTAEIYFSATITDAKPTDEDIRKRAEVQEQAIRQTMREFSNNPAMLQRLERALSENYAVVSKQVLQNAKRSVQGVYWLGGEYYGGDRLVEFRLKRGYED